MLQLVLGPLFYAIYVAPIASIIASLGISHMQFADDTQPYIVLSGANVGLCDFL